MNIPKRVKNIIIIFVVLVIILISASFFIKYNNPRYSDFQLENFHSADAKLGYKGYVVTSKNNHMYLINSYTKEVNETFIRSNWVDALVDENVIVYASMDKAVGLCLFDPEDASITENYLIANDGSLRIDPSIAKLNNKYYLTTTVVEGTINRDNYYEDNGFYKVQIFQSEDLINWTLISDVLALESNIEDVELNTDNGYLQIIYEVETIDKGPSKIQLMESRDYGLSWSYPTTLINNGADNEPASFCKSDDEYWLFYSSDINRIGSSYEGSEAFLARFDTNLELLNIIQLNTDIESQLLLYEVLVNDGISTVLYSKDYLGSDDLCLETKNFTELQNLGG